MIAITRALRLHDFAGRLLSHIRALYIRFQIGGRLADVPIMFTLRDESIINLGQPLLKVLLMS
ncbi:hypothetical protein Kim5_PC00114 (plasmid) [Rhizobium sp. Kim5]|nr:hypothetical protein Kim5_PC00114 [Rhizobium sp. Kim5]